MQMIFKGPEILLILYRDPLLFLEIFAFPTFSKITQEPQKP